MVEVIPGINEKSFTEIVRKIELVKPYVSWIEIDVMDNTLIDFDTYNNFEDFNIIASQINLEAHLMVLDPLKYLQTLHDNGFKRVVAQVEGNDIRELIIQAKLLGMEVGLSLDAESHLELVEPYLEEIDCVQIMMAKMGVSGQAMDPAQLFKIKQIRNHFPDLPISVDCGINKQTAPTVFENGATRLVVTSYLFAKNQDRIGEAIGELAGI